MRVAYRYGARASRHKGREEDHECFDATPCERDKY
jgi:hypothetical protein